PPPRRRPWGVRCGRRRPATCAPRTRRFYGWRLVAGLSYPPHSEPSGSAFSLGPLWQAHPSISPCCVIDRSISPSRSVGGPALPGVSGISRGAVGGGRGIVRPWVV